MRDDQGIRPDVGGTTATGSGLEPPSERPAVSSTERPWGGFRQYAHNQPVTVSLMSVLPGQRLSLQAHANRSELWVVLDEGAVVQVGSESRSCRAGEEIWIAAGQPHRLSCAAGTTIRVLEVAFGTWDVADIERFDDEYGRS